MESSCLIWNIHIWPKYVQVDVWMQRTEFLVNAVVYTILKGTLLRDFWPPFFYHRFPPWPLITNWNIFNFRFTFCGYIWILSDTVLPLHYAAGSRSIIFRAGGFFLEGSQRPLIVKSCHMWFFSPDCSFKGIVVTSLELS